MLKVVKIIAKLRNHAYDERWIVKKVKDNPRISAPKLINYIATYLGKTVHPETIRRVLRKQNFDGCSTRNKSLISEKNKKKRLNFARDYLNKEFNFWKEIIFTNENKFNIIFRW